MIRRLRASLGPLALVAYAIAQFAGSFHDVVDIHRICAEHGELVEANGAQSAAAPITADRATIARGAARGTEHEHCPLPTHRRAAPAAAPAALTTSVAVTPIEPPSGLPSSRSSIAILRFAPKASPPLS